MTLFSATLGENAEKKHQGVSFFEPVDSGWIKIQGKRKLASEIIETTKSYDKVDAAQLCWYTKVDTSNCIEDC